MTYSPEAYWTQRGKQPEHGGDPLVVAGQEARLLAALSTFWFDSVLEFGCGSGRITRLVHDRWPHAAYTATDLSADRLYEATETTRGVWFQQSRIDTYSGPGADLVLAVEVLMHQPPEQIEEAVVRFLQLGKHVVTVDWTEPKDGPIAPWNFRYDYAALYGDRLISREVIGLQSIHVVRGMA